MHALLLNKANNVIITIAIEFLSRSVLRHLINESQSRSAIESNYETTTTNFISLGKLFQLRKQYLITGLSTDISGYLFILEDLFSKQKKKEF
ncbi:unnamed protein product [Rotaria sp. Silwood2]|nr:unnamed protein product [Rotaria sp. Silwood2]CAF2518323.1 unnamed protein product [Rotaria sp. Silwood2]CAF2809996.1 unnamed protein product [Rotaria sp. Silwood2]CAF2915045.1 unnamed protein product [Rotaria sp. Silwood2]CAF4060495.1 unnamed protein product [Rotaria sp. Silwood2]